MSESKVKAFDDEHLESKDEVVNSTNTDDDAFGKEEEVMMGGVALGDDMADYWSDDGEEDDGVTIIVGSNDGQSGRLQNSAHKRARPLGSHQKDYTPGGRDAFTPSKTQVVDYLKPLRFTYHRTAFDIDLDNLDKQPWKDPHVDTSLYFNYGFNETTWQYYCEKQLARRQEAGEGPPVLPTPVGTPAAPTPGGV